MDLKNIAIYILGFLFLGSLVISIFHNNGQEES